MPGEDLLQQAYQFAKHGKYEAALGIFREHGGAQGHYGAGACLFKLGRFEEAHEELNRCLELEPEDAKAKRLLDRIRSRAEVGKPARRAPSVGGLLTAEIRIPRRVYVWGGVLVVLGLIVLAGMFRLYYGGGMGAKLVRKHSFSFKDTIVNLDNIIGQPRIKVAAEHPAVKRQLEEMGVMETDKDVERRIYGEIDANTDKYRREIEEAMNR